MKNCDGIIPSVVLRDKNLSDKSKLLYGQLYRLSKDKDYCIVSDKHLGELVNGKDRTISSLLLRLERNKFIKRVTEYDNGQRIRKIYIKNQGEILR